MKLSLPIKFALLSFVVTLFGVFGVALMAYIESDALLQKEAIQGISMSLRKDLVTIEGQLSKIKNDVVYLSQSNEVRQWANHGLKDRSDVINNKTMDMNKIETLFSIVLSRRAMYYQVRLIGIDDGGLELVRVKRLKQDVSVIETDMLQPKGKRSYFKNSIKLKAGDILFSDITLNREHGEITEPPQPMLRVSTAIYSDTGQLRGILLINANFNTFTASLQQSLYRFFIASPQGDYLIHSNENKAMAFEYQREERFQNDYQINKKTLQRSYQQGGSSIKEYLFDDQGVTLLLGKIYLDDSDRKNFLKVGAIVELSQLRQQSIGLRDRMLVLTFLLALVLGCITFIFAKYFTRPIRNMIAAAVKIGEGEKNVSIPVYLHDEIGILGAALQHMVQQLTETQRKTEAMNISLEENVTLRTAELARLTEELEAQNSALEKAVIKAEQAAMAKSQFLATMSHEIRTPLNGVLGLTELLLSTELSASQHDSLTTVQSSGEALLAILNDILDFSKIEAGLMKINPGEFNPNLVVEHVAKLFSKRISLDGGDVELVVRGIPHLPNLLIGDAGRLQQVLMNLMSNAVKFTSAGDITIAADVISESEKSVHVRFKVEDTGHGISTADQKQLFKEFTQADGTDSRKHGGTGLGLAIVERLVKLMGGEVAVDSEVGKGSCFFFDLALTKASEIFDRPQNFHEHFSQWRMLIVDDNIANQSMLHDLLTAWGVECDVTSDGNSALQYLQDMSEAGTPYDAVLIEKELKGKSEITLPKYIKKSMYISDVKVIMMTSSSFHFDEKVRMDYGWDGFLRKPIYLNSLFETILSVMHVRQRKVIYKPVEHVVERRERILLAEDNQVNQQVATGMLKQQGFIHIDVANDGVEAFDLFSQHAYDLVLMDIQMPKLDGIAAAQKIRSLEQISNETPTPMIALTAHALDEDKKRTSDAGMNDHLTKPLTGKLLKAVLDRWLPLSMDEQDEGRERVSQETPVQKIETENRVVETLIVDESFLRQLRVDLGFGIGIILDTYLEDLPKQVDTIIAAVNSSDSDTLRRSGHKLKGSSRSVAAGPLAELCFQIEQLGENNDIAAAALLTDQLKQLSKQVIQALSANSIDDIR